MVLYIGFKQVCGQRRLFNIISTIISYLKRIHVRYFSVVRINLFEINSCDVLKSQLAANKSKVRSVPPKALALPGYGKTLKLCKCDMGGTRKSRTVPQVTEFQILM